jgi:spermidine/putrescine transport system permease protein
MNKVFKALALPYQIWLYILVFIPLLAMVAISISNYDSSIPLSQIDIGLAHWSILFQSQNLIAFRNSVTFAILTTLICFILGYFTAYFIFQSKFKNKFIILTIVILPMWSNLILRVDALNNVFSKNNILSSIFGFSPFGDITGTSLAILIGLVFTYLPFMILPVYTALEKIDYALQEAALDLGLTPFKKFWKVIFPLSLKGVITGSIMVFLPTLAGFAIPKILGKGKYLFIGNVIENKLLSSTIFYNHGSLFAVVILVFILGSILILTRFDKEGETLL